MIEIEKDTPEIRRTLEHLRSLSGVTVVHGRKAGGDCAWDRAVTAGAVPLDEFGAKFGEEIRNEYNA